ncbi:MAG: PQQ-dependent sugar dehydrogenase [Actinobacteria bacterium]|nr:PQQ-dependent sugar dehydrogenase [Actinomycetota bacterium]
MRPRLVPAVLMVLALAETVGLAACGGSGASTDRTTTATETAAPVPRDAARPGGPKSGGKLGLKKVGDFEHPVYVVGAPGYPRLLFVVEQEGRVVVLDGGKRLGRPFLDVRSLVDYDGAERGLLSIAFPPDYGESGRFYVYFVNKGGSIEIDEFHRQSSTRAASRSRRAVITIPHPDNANHNGGQMQFLGEDLYFGTGDGGAAGDPPNNAQNKNVLLGKLLRIDPLPAEGKPYTVPASNPFVGAGGRPEIYSYGLRNPFRFSFDSVTNPQEPRIVIGDVGQNKFEEIDYTTVAAARGANFGWDAIEGFRPYEEEDSGTPDPGGTAKPILAYPHSRDGSCSVIGGYVVADRSLPSLYKRYVYADYCEGQLRVLTPHLRRASGDHKLGLAVASPTSFGEDDAHHLYVASQDGPVYRLVQR